MKQNKMNVFVSKYILMLIFLTSILAGAQDINIIPKPVSIETNGQEFKIQESTPIIYTKGLEEQAKLLSEMISPSTGWDFEIKSSEEVKEGAIFLELVKDQNFDTEEYHLSVTDKGIHVSALNSAGIFYGLQSLLQLLPEEIYNDQRIRGKSWLIPGLVVKDKPSYVWRGMMLDVSRYFFEKEYVLHFMDMMAMYKLNTLHFHLIDDAGWRLEIKKYPRLTSVGAWSGEGKNRRGGYYTQEEIKEIVAYGATRNIQVIPEIEVPAHTLGAIAAYPHLSCEEKEVKVQKQHYISDDLYCVGKESTFEFLDDVFKETFDLFPSKYLHIGGDEAKYDKWKKCPHCQKRKNDEGLQTEAELQVYFNRRIQQMVKKYDKTIVGWDEIIEEGLKEKAVGMIWHDKNKANTATKMGHDVVMALTESLYFDFAESNIPGEVKAATWLPPISLEKTYSFDPMINEVALENRNQILGGNACLWSDQFIHGTILQRIAPINENRAEQYMDYLTFPRLSAFAETVWTPKSQKNWNDFQDRMKSHYARYDAAGYGYRMPIPYLVSNNKKGNAYEIILDNKVMGTTIKYTTDGSRPNTYSMEYSKPILVDRLENFQAITVKSRQQYSLPLYFPKDYSYLKNHGVVVREWRAKDIKAEKPSSLDLDLTGKINKNNKYILSFHYTDGKNDLMIESLALYKNGREILTDINSKIVGKNSKKASYSFEISNYETGASFSIKAQLKGVNKNDSYGVILIK